MGIGYFGMYMGIQPSFQEEKLFNHVFREKIQERILLSSKMESIHTPDLQDIWGFFCSFVSLYVCNLALC